LNEPQTAKFIVLIVQRCDHRAVPIDSRN
jgi:hypothetical protein